MVVLLLISHCVIGGLLLLPAILLLLRPPIPSAAEFGPFLRIPVRELRAAGFLTRLATVPHSRANVYLGEGDAVPRFFVGVLSPPHGDVLCCFQGLGMTVEVRRQDGTPVPVEAAEMTPHGMSVWCKDSGLAFQASFFTQLKFRFQVRTPSVWPVGDLVVMPLLRGDSKDAHLGRDIEETVAWVAWVTTPAGLWLIWIGVCLSQERAARSKPKPVPRP